MEFGPLHIGNLAIQAELALLIVFITAASIYDVKSRRIPNWLIATGLATSFIYQGFSNYGFGLEFWAAGFAVGFLCFLPLYVLGAMGAGDVKLMALVGSFVGGKAAFLTIILTLLAGGALALGVMLWNGSWRLVYENVKYMMLNMTMTALSKQIPKAEAPAKSAGNLPYGVAITAGALLYVAFFRP